MPTNSDSERFRCEYFVWKLFVRGGIYYADGRGAGQRLGKHTLDTRNPAEALVELRRLDRRKAIERGMAVPQQAVAESTLEIECGWQMYLDHRDSPGILRGLSPRSRDRYRQAGNKHINYCKDHGVEIWGEVTEDHGMRYGRWLSRKHAERGVYLLLVMLQAAHRWLMKAKYLPTSARFSFQLDRPDGSETYCFARAEVAAMIQHCRQTRGLAWLESVITIMACSGVRISELVGLRWSDVDLQAGMIVLTDERASRRRNELGNARRVKGKRTRRIPISKQLHVLLSSLPRNEDGRLLHDAAGRPLLARRVRRALIRDVIQPLAAQFPTPPGEVGFEHGRPHSFRHFFVSECFRQGAMESEIMCWTGHRDPRLVALYRHLRQEDGIARMSRIQFIAEPVVPTIDGTNA